MVNRARGGLGRDWRDELAEVTFRCGVCRHTWQSAPDLVEPAEDQPHHPWRYFGDCPACDAPQQAQAPWEIGLLKAHQCATGPRTAEGKAATAANLEGHPTPEEAMRTRFNAMKTGLHARTATYFPAKPDGYAFCQRCDVDRYWCLEQPACVKQTELFMLHQAAFEQRDPKVLGRVHGDLHAALVASLQMCLQAVLADGVVIKTPKVQLDKDGQSVALTFFDEKGAQHNVLEYQANPAFKPIADLVTRLGLSLGDLGMTAKAADDDEAALRGRLGGGVGEGADRETLDAFAQRMAQALVATRELMAGAQADAAADPVLLEHQAATGQAASKMAGTPTPAPARKG